MPVCYFYHAHMTKADLATGETDVRAQPTGGDFLERERAALGDDADFFSTNDTPAQNQGARVEDGDDDDLLGGDDDFPAPQASGTQDDDLDGFESSFPAIDARNDVRSAPTVMEVWANRS